MGIQLKTAVLVPLSPRVGASTLGANIAAFWAAAGVNTGFLDLSDTVLQWEGIPTNMTVIPPDRYLKLVEQGDIDAFHAALHLIPVLDRLIISLPYANNPLFWTTLTLDPQIVVLTRLETALGRSLDSFMGMIENIRKEMPHSGIITGLLIKLATQGPSTDEMIRNMASAFGDSVVFSPVAHVKALAETEHSLLCSRTSESPISSLIADISRRLGDIPHEPRPDASFEPLARIAVHEGTFPSGWQVKARSAGLSVTQNAPVSSSSSETIDVLAAEIEHLQKELEEASRIQQILQDQISELEQDRKAASDKSSQNGDMQFEVTRLKGSLENALAEAESLLHERNALRDELSALKQMANAQDNAGTAIEIDSVAVSAADMGEETQNTSEAEKLRQELDGSLVQLHELKLQLDQARSMEAQISELRDALKAQITERTTREVLVASEMATIRAKLEMALGALANEKPPELDPSRIDTLQNEVESLTRKLAETENHLHGYKAERDLLAQKSERLESEINLIRDRPPSPETELLRGEVGRLRIQLETAKNHIHGFVAERDQAMAEAQKIKAELEAERASPPEIPVEIELDPGMEIEKEKLEQQLKRSETEIISLKRESAELRSQLEKAETARRVFSRERNDLMEQFRSLKHEAETLYLADRQLIEGHNELVSVIRSDRDRYRAQFEVQDALYQKLKAQLEPIRETLRVGLSELPGLRMRAEQAEHRIRELEAECERLRHEASSTITTDHHSRDEISRLKQEVDEARTLLGEAETRLEESALALKAAHQEKEQAMKDTISGLESALEKSAKAADLAAIRAQTAEKALENRTRQHHEAMNALQAEQRFRMESLERDLTTARAELSALTVQAANAQRLQDELDEVRHQMSAARSLADEATSARQLLETRIRELEQQIETHRAGSEDGRNTKYDSLLRELADARVELQDLRLRSGRAAVAEKIATERAARIVQLEGEIEELNRRIGSSLSRP